MFPALKCGLQFPRVLPVASTDEAPSLVSVDHPLQRETMFYAYRKIIARFFLSTSSAHARNHLPLKTLPTFYLE